MYKPLPSADMNDSIRADRLSSILERMCESIQKNVKLCTNIDFCVSDVENKIVGYVTSGYILPILFVAVHLYGVSC